MPSGLKIADAYVAVRADMDNVGKDVDRGMSKAGQKGGTVLGGGLKKGVGGALKGLGGIAAAAFTVGAVTDFFGGVIEEGREAQKVGAQTGAVIKSMGATSWTSADQIGKLAAAISNKTGIDDEAIQSGQNLLLTFGDVQNKAGEGNNIFDRATKAMTDMSVATGKSMPSAANMLGKALNDPLAGLSALSRVGVQFTGTQTEQIKAMVASGDAMGAQKIILSEMEKQFGGSAEAQATAGDKLKTTWANFQEEIGGKVLPIIDKLFNFLSTKVVPALSKAADFLIVKVIPALATFGEWIQKNSGWLVPLVGIIGSIIAAVKVYTAVQAALNIVMAMNPVGLLVIGIAALVAGFVILWNKSDAFRGFFIGMWNGIKAAIGAVVSWFTDTALPAIKGFFEGIGKAVGAVISWVKKNWPLLLGILLGPIGLAVVAIIKNWDKIKAGFKAAFDWVKKNVFDKFVLGLKVLAAAFAYGRDQIKAKFEGVRERLRSIWNWIDDNVFAKIRGGITAVKNAFSAGKTAIYNAFKGVSTLLGNIWASVRDGAFAKIKGGITAVKNAFSAGKTAVYDAFKGVKDKLLSVWNSVKSGVFDKFTNFLGTGKGSIRSAFTSAVNGIGRIWDGLKAKAKEPVKFLVNTVWNDGLRKMINAIPGVELDKVKLGFASGGSVRGPGSGTSDSIMAKLSNGEHVWTAKEVRAAGGQDAMYRMRQAVLKGNLNGDPRFAKGGTLTPEQIANGQAFARRQSGKPYGWGAVGSGSYDCSGIVSAVTNVLRGQYAHRRVGSTASFPWAGFQKGPGQFTVGSTKNYGGSGVGHMASSLAGMRIESRGGRGVLINGDAMMTNSSGFDGQWHLGAGGKDASKFGGLFSVIADAIKILKTLPAQIDTLMGKGGWMVGYLKKGLQGMWAMTADHINDLPLVPGTPVPRNIPVFDNGGTLGKGLNLVNNKTGGPEELRRPEQMKGGGDIIYTGDINVTIDAATMEQLKTAEDFFKNIGIQTRKKGVR